MTPDPIAEAVEAALAGRLIVIPTDTVYGIGTRADDAAATARIFEAKGRSREADLPVLLASLEDARKVAVFDERAEKLAVAFWPGKLTIVLPRSEASRSWSLGGAGGTVGLRVPGHSLARAIAREAGPLAITSANTSGESVCTTCDELEAAFGERVTVYICEEQPLPTVASTVVELAGRGHRILREGAIGAGEIAAVLG